MNGPQTNGPADNARSSGVAREPNKVRVTTPYMTKYERARILGTRALQIRCKLRCSYCFNPSLIAVHTTSSMNGDDIVAKAVRASEFATYLVCTHIQNRTSLIRCIR